MLRSYIYLVQVEEIYNFSQDDLLTEDILILDTQAEVFIWIGQSVDPKEKQNAWEIGQVGVPELYCVHFEVQVSFIHVVFFFSQKYVEMAASLEGLSPHVPLYKVSEGNEPCFFTTYFSWDYTKAVVCIQTLITRLLLNPVNFANFNEFYAVVR